MYPQTNYLSRGQRNLSLRRSLWQPYRLQTREPPQFTTIPTNEILLGVESRNFEERPKQVTIPYYPNKRMAIIIVGGQGSGKSVLGKNILDQLIYRFNHPAFVIDPKWDFHSIIKPNTNKKQIELLAAYDQRPYSYDAEFIAPKFMNLEDSLARKMKNEIGISPKDFHGLDTDTAPSLLCDLLEIKSDESAYAIVRSLFTNPTDNIREMEERVEEIIEDLGAKSERIKWKLKNMIDTKTISDDFYDLVNKMNEKKIVVFEGVIADEKANEFMMQGNFVNIAINKIILGRKKGLFKKCPVIYMDEANTFCGENGKSSGIMVMLSSKYREIRAKPGVTSIVLSQYLYELSKKIVTEADYIICPKVIEQKDIDLLKNRGSNPYLTHDLYYDVKNPPNEFIIYGKNGLEDYQIFTGLPTRGSMSSA